MITTIKTIFLLIGLTLTPLIVRAQSQADTLLLFEKCIGLEDMQQYYPVDASGAYGSVNIMQYPVHFNLEDGSTHAGKEIRVYERTGIADSKVKSYFSFRSVEINQNTARVNMSYFYDYDYTNKNFKVLLVNVNFIRAAGEWNIASITIKGDVK
jgi:N12 class adenine-specific DNA methylase